MIFTTHNVSVRPGGVSVMFSDGVTEATDPDGEEFGEERLGLVIQEAAGASATDLVRRIEASRRMVARRASRQRRDGCRDPPHRVTRHPYPALRPVAWLPGRHLRTIVPALWPVPPVPLPVESIEVGVATDAAVRVDVSRPRGSARGTIVLVHGL